MERKVSLQTQVEDLKAENAALREQNALILKRLENVERQSGVLAATPPPPKPNGAISSRIRHGYEQQKPRLQAMLRQTLATDDAYMPIQRAHNGLFYDPSQGGPYPTRMISANELPRAVASVLTGEAETRYCLARLKAINECYEPNDPRNGNAPKIARLEVELAELESCTDDLVASTPLTLHPSLGIPQAKKGSQRHETWLRE